MGCFQDRYDSRVVIYDRKLFIILATGEQFSLLYRAYHDDQRNNSDDDDDNDDDDTSSPDIIFDSNSTVIAPTAKSSMPETTWLCLPHPSLASQ